MVIFSVSWSVVKGEALFSLRPHISFTGAQRPSTDIKGDTPQNERG